MNNIFLSAVSSLFGKFDLQGKRYYTTQQIGSTTPEWINTTNKWILYNELPELQAVVNRLAKMKASAIPKVVDKDGNVIDPNNHWIFELIDRPNAMQSWGQMMYMVSINKAITNNALIYSPERSFNIHDMLLPIAFNNVDIIPTGKKLTQLDKEGFIKGFKLPENIFGQSVVIEPKDMIYFCEPDGISLFNTRSKLDSLKYPLSNIAAQYKKRNVLLNNLFALGVLSGQNSDGVSSIPLDSTDKEEMQKDLAQRNDGKVVITDTPMQWNPMSFPTRDLMLYEELTADMIALVDAYGLNQHMFGANSSSKGSTFSNVENGVKQAYNSTIIPDTQDDYDELTRQLKLDKEGMFLVPDFSHISELQDDENKKSQALLSRSQALEKIVMQVELSDEERRSILGI
jgi:hypothetical protein